MKKIVLFILLGSVLITSCETEKEKLQREQKETELKAEKAAHIEEEMKEKAIYDQYINNSLATGSTPYAYCFGKNYACSDYGCSQITIKTPYNSDVLVTIKKNDKVYRHAYINSGSSFAFEFPNGEYQAFFYYGKGWNPNKVMKALACGPLKGGFVADEQFSKDSPQQLENTILSYELILQENGNFSTKPSNADEIF